MISEPTEYFNVKQTAELLGVHENTVRRWAKSGTLVTSSAPGASRYRFSREHVERVARERGESQTELALTQVTPGPELARAIDIDRWGSTVDAKGAFPDLIRRLLGNTPGITNVEMRAYEGVAAPGWDGSATSTGATVLPDGALRFELGTDAKPKYKAQSDYDKRVPPTEEDARATFVFVTPRNWAGGQDWAAERARDGHFAGVRVIDAHTIETWLLQVPVVHQWLSERMGYQPRDASTITAWWSRFSARTHPRLPESFFVAGRDAQAKELLELLRSKSINGPITISAPWGDDVIAFVFAATMHLDHAHERTIIVRDQSAWLRLSDSDEPLILIPDFREGLDLTVALDNGHHVILPAGTDDIVRGSRRIDLPRIGREEGAAALKGFPGRKVESLVALARRNMPALFRRLGRDSRYPVPPWALQPDVTAIVAPLICVGTWSNADGDQRIIERLTGAPHDQIEQLLSSLAAHPDPPFVRSGGNWRLASPAEAALILLPELTEKHYSAWSDIAVDVLLESDPFSGMDVAERLKTQLNGVRATTSAALKRGLANALALAAATSEDLPTFRVQRHVDHIVRRLLTQANTLGSSGWSLISSALPSLAEASPDIFLDAVDEDLGMDAPHLASLFRDTSNGIWGHASPHPSLLWALEALCWSPDHFARSASMLARLVRLTLDRKSSTSPLDSLSNAVLGWVKNSAADATSKIEVAQQIHDRDPEVGWKLILELLPRRHASSIVPNKPDHRDWSPAEESVTFAEWTWFIEATTTLAIEAAGHTADRWQALIPRLDELPTIARGKAFEALEVVVTTGCWSADERAHVWRVIEDEAVQHREFSSTDWALPPDEVERLEAIARAIEPADHPLRFVSAFSWRTTLPGMPRSSEDYARERDRLRQATLDAVIPQGDAVLSELSLAVEDAHGLGVSLGSRTDAPSNLLIGWLDHNEPNLVQVATAFVARRVVIGGFDELKRILNSEHAATERAQINALGTMPFGRAAWEWASTLTPSQQDLYWSSVRPFRIDAGDLDEALHLLCTHHKAWQALELLSHAIAEDPKPSVTVADFVMDSLLAAKDPPTQSSMAAYHLEQVLTFLEETAPGHPQLPSYEFIFFEFLHDHRPSDALYKHLGANPAEFVAFVSMVYRGEEESPRTPSAQDEARARLAWIVLREWRSVPGLLDDGTVDGTHLTEWVSAARLGVAESARASVGDEVIGEVLAASPIGIDGAWPAEPVRDIIESVRSSRLDTGLAIGRYNQRGVHSRGLLDGGAQERTLEADYRAWASQIASKWPRTARILRGIADDYAHEAEHHDADSERRADDG